MIPALLHRIGDGFAMPRAALRIADKQARSRGATRPRFAKNHPHKEGACDPQERAFATLKEEGAGKTGCALHPRSHVQCASKENAHEHTGSAEAVRPSLRNGSTAYFVLSPVTGLSCHRRPHRLFNLCDLDTSVGVSGPHDFTVRENVIRLVTLPRPSLPAPTSVAIAIRPSSRARDRCDMPVICTRHQRR